MKKSLLFSLIFGFLIIPQITFAAWWNPTTWFNNWSFFYKSENTTEVLEKRIQELESRLKNSSSASTTEITSTSSVETKTTPEIKKTTPIVDNSSSIKTQVPLEKIKTPVIKVEEPKKEISIPTPPPSPVTFKVTRLTQKIFEETLTTWAYGGFEISVEIFANGGDIFIPMTTNDSTTGITGFTYSIKGDPFRGKQNSQVSCILKTDTYCKIKDGNSGVITTTVWLTPNQSGNYGIGFDKIRAKIGMNGTLQTYDIGKETEHIYISY